jgi:hypothetical protein
MNAPVMERKYAGRHPREWDFTTLQSLDPHLENKEQAVNRKPLIIAVGANRGGTGKTTVARCVSDYLHARGANAKLFDSESPSGDLQRFAPSATIVDIAKTAGQMAVFDTLDGVTLLDVRAGQFSHILRALDEAKLLDDVRSGALNLALLHVLTPTDRSFDEIAEIAGIIGGGARHFLVRNHINEGDFSDWERDIRIVKQLRSMEGVTISVPHLTFDACDVLQKRGLGFDTFARDATQSRMLRGFVRSWLDLIWLDLDRVKLGELVAQAISDRPAVRLASGG